MRIQLAAMESIVYLQPNCDNMLVLVKISKALDRNDYIGALTNINGEINSIYTQDGHGNHDIFSLHDK